jgi:hypothetical protein
MLVDRVLAGKQAIVDRQVRRKMLRTSEPRGTLDLGIRQHAEMCWDGVLHPSQIGGSDDVPHPNAEVLVGICVPAIRVTK